MRRLVALPPLAMLLMLAAPLAAQSHDHPPDKAGEKAKAKEGKPAAPPLTPMAAPVVPLRLPGMPQPEAPPPVDHKAMGHGAMDHGDMDHGTAPAEDAPPPARAMSGPRHAADAIWAKDAMASARQQLKKENGGMSTGMFLIERLEARVSDSAEAFLWDVQGWYGGDIHRVFLKSEGEGEFGGTVEDAEVQVLFSRAIGPFFDLQAGARVDLEPETRSHLVLGVQGLAPYMWHVDGALFLSDQGDLTGRIEAEHDQKITQQLILQPRMELELSAQDIAERAVGAGLTKIEAGLRLRYEIRREFAPYVGVGYEAKLGQTADFARAAGEGASGFALLAGIRAWF
ncbi:copper resistance protein B [Parerythrobacter jejuensis]